MYENGTLIWVDELSISCFGFIFNTFNTIFRDEIFPALNVIFSSFFSATVIICTFTSALVPHWPNFLLIINSIRLVDLFKWARHSGFLRLYIKSTQLRKNAKLIRKTVLVIMPGTHVYESMIIGTDSVFFWMNFDSQVLNMTFDSIKTFREWTGKWPKKHVNPCQL